MGMFSWNLQTRSRRFNKQENEQIRSFQAAISSMKGINRGCSRRFGSGGGHARMCGQGSQLRALRIRRCQGKSQGKGVLAEQAAHAKALRWQRVVWPSTGKQKVNRVGQG